MILVVFWNNDVCVVFCWFNKLIMYWFYDGDILFDDRINRMVFFVNIFYNLFDDMEICVCVDIKFYIYEVVKFFIFKNENVFKNNDIFWFDWNGFFRMCM